MAKLRNYRLMYFTIIWQRSDPRMSTTRNQLYRWTTSEGAKAESGCNRHLSDAIGFRLRSFLASLGTDPFPPQWAPRLEEKRAIPFPRPLTVLHGTIGLSFVNSLRGFVCLSDCFFFARARNDFVVSHSNHFIHYLYNSL